MKQPLRQLFSPLLNKLESGDEAYAYQPSHRKILTFLGFILSVLAMLILASNWGGDIGYLFPALFFGGIGFLSLVVGLLGNDRAVAKIWGSR